LALSLIRMVQFGHFRENMLRASLVSILPLLAVDSRDMMTIAMRMTPMMDIWFAHFFGGGR